jgi:hypothetical protein
MAPSIKRVALLLGTAVTAGTILGTAAPAQAWCFQQSPNPVENVYVCSSGDCRVTVLGDPVVTCP